MNELKKDKIKTIIFISIVMVILAAVALVFYFIILYTPNINIKVNFVSNGALGSVDSRISNASNGAPTHLFNYDYTSGEPVVEEWKIKNLIFKGDDQTITLQFRVSNNAHFKTLAQLQFKSPHKNANVVCKVDDVETDISNYVLNPYSEHIITITIGKIEIKDPLRANLNMDFILTPQ